MSNFNPELFWGSEHGNGFADKNSVPNEGLILSVLHFDVNKVNISSWAKEMRRRLENDMFDVGDVPDISVSTLIQIYMTDRVEWKREFYDKLQSLIKTI